MLREDWFPTPIWSIQTDIDTKIIAEKCLRMRAEGSANRVKSNYGGWQSVDLNWDEHKELYFLQESLIKYINLLAEDVDPDLKLTLDNVWVNINEKNDRNIPHIHPCSWFAGTIYIQTDENTGDIRFTNKWCPSIHYGFQPRNSKVFYEHVTYKPKNGMILLFPAWLNHFVLPNQSDLTRISISFNVRQET